MYHKYFLVLVSCLLFIAMAGCSKKDQSTLDPKRRLTDYIALSFAVKDSKDRQSLSNYLTGSAKTRLAAWSDEQFRQAFVETKRQFLKLVIDEVKAINSTETNITYELIYTDQSKGKGTKVTNKKMAHLVSEQGVWMISDVRNIKELVEYQNEMSLP